MIVNFKNNLKNQIINSLKHKYPLNPNQVELSPTPNIKMGDFALTFPFHLGQTLNRNPREIATEIVPLLSSLYGVNKVEVAGPGYINLFLDRKDFFLRQLRSLSQTSLTPEERKIIIEHTNINPNKAAHIGHLRNACLGDTLSRCLKFKGENVEIQNYIDDTGVQVVDVVFGFMDLEKKSLPDIQNIDQRFDYYCWDLYTRVSSYLESHPEAQTRRSQILKNIEEGKNPEAEIAYYVSRQILKAHVQTMDRIGVSYDLLPCESSILGLKFWEKAFQLLKEKKAVYYAQQGKNKGCWVMKVEEEGEKEKVIVRSDGTVTYVGKDIAYQLWKFGLLKRDFYYQPFLEDKGHTIWITTSSSSHPQSPEFGKGSLVYNVIDIRQSFLQKIVVQGLKSLDYLEQAKKSIHFSYEMVALSPKSLKELNITLPEEGDKKDFLEVSGRKGLGVKADDLLDRLEEKALSEVEKRNPELTSSQKKEIAHKIAQGALRYFMLKFTRNTIIVFDFDEALSFEGETGPYLQYTLVRINSIFRKLKQRQGWEEKNIPQLFSFDHRLSLNGLSQQEKDDFWEIVLYASQLEEKVIHSIYSLEFSHLAKFCFNLCQKFNSYYHLYSILGEKNPEIKNIRILTIHYLRETLKKALNIMGIPQPEKM